MPPAVHAQAPLANDDDLTALYQDVLARFSEDQDQHTATAMRPIPSRQRSSPDPNILSIVESYGTDYGNAASNGNVTGSYYEPDRPYQPYSTPSPGPSLSPPLPVPPPPPPLPRGHALPTSPRPPGRRPLPPVPQGSNGVPPPSPRLLPDVRQPYPPEKSGYGGYTATEPPYQTSHDSYSDPRQLYAGPVQTLDRSPHMGLNGDRNHHALPPGAGLPAPPAPAPYPGQLNGRSTSRSPIPKHTHSSSETTTPVSTGSSNRFSPDPHAVEQLSRSGFVGSGGLGLSPGLERHATGSTSTSGYGADGTYTPPTTVERVPSLGSSIYAPASDLDTKTYRPAPPTAPYVPESYNPPSSQRGESSRHAARQAETIQRLKGSIDLDIEEDEDFEDIYEDDPDRYVNLELLSHLAVRLRDRVPRGTHVKGGIPYDRAFTGRDIVSTIQSAIQRDLLVNLGISTNDRRIALGVARSLQSQLFFYEVEWGGRQLSDGVEDVFMFLDDEGSGDVQRDGLPTGVITLLTECYSPSCVEEDPCYAYACPRRSSQRLAIDSTPKLTEDANEEAKGDKWIESVPPHVLRSLPQSEIMRQTIIRKVIEKEEQYVQDLDTIEAIFIKPLRQNNPIRIAPDDLDSFLDTVFGNLLDLRECNRRLLETMYVRKREQAPIIQFFGDIFLTAAAEFRLPYPNYVGHLPLAEKRMKDELEHNAEFRHFVETCARHPEARRFDLRHFLNRPSEHLQRYPVLLEAIWKDTAEGNNDAEFLQEAIDAIRKLSGVAQLRTFQSAMLRGPTAKLEWHDLVSPEIRESMSKHDVARQSSIFELIKGEMEYVKDLENIKTLFVQPLKTLNPPVVARDRLPQFIEDVFFNLSDIMKQHKRLLERLHEIQRDEHPIVRSITAPIFDAALNWRDAYMDFIPHYPIAAYRVDEEIANNLAFKSFVEQCTRDPDARKLDIKAFIYRPIPRLLRYDLLLKAIMSNSPSDHEDKSDIPQVLEVIKSLGKDSEPGVVAAKQKVELWRYNSHLVFKTGEVVDMDLLDESRTLIHTGKLLRQADTSFEWSGWSELFVLLFDNYLIMTKPKEKDGVTKYHVNRRPIPLDLLTLAGFGDPPQQRGGAGLLRGVRRGGGSAHAEGTPSAIVPPAASTQETTVDARTVYPCTLHCNGRGGLVTLYAESAQARAEWKEKLEEALALRRAVTENNKAFEIEPLSGETFFVPALQGAANPAAWNQETTITGKVTCSVPFSTADGMRLVAVGCAEGVWIGLRHDSKSLRRVLHLKMVTQCAMLEDFGIFLVLADKALWAYHIEALVPSSPPRPNTTRAPQKLNHHRDVQFFSVGTLNGRTLLVYMKKKSIDSVFHVLEPVVGKIPEKTKTPGTFGRSLFGSQKSDWFRPFREFFLPCDAFDLIFLKGKIAVLCTRGFEIMDLTTLKSVTIPSKDDAKFGHLTKRTETSKALGMFRSSENEFLLCYGEFGVYVNRYGDPSRQANLIEWEGTAERVAFHPPHVLLFDSRFIEVRQIETGRLAQIIQGADIRCIWDGRGANIPPVTTPGPNGWQESPGQGGQEARIHAVMKAPDSPRPAGQPYSRPYTEAQLIVELVPTVPLYLPGSLASPSGSAYFPQSQSTVSPPHSPRLQPQRSYR